MKIRVEEDKKQEDDQEAYYCDTFDQKNLMLKPDLQKPDLYILNNSSSTENVLLDMEYLPVKQEK